MEANAPENGFKSQLWAQLAVLKLVLPKLPFILRVVVQHILQLSESAKYIDLRSDVIVSFLRDMILNGDPLPVSKTQALTTRDPGIKGRIWISSVVSQAPPELSVRDTLLAAIDSIKKEPVPGNEKCRIPNVVPVTAEWTGYRAAAHSNSRLPAISEKEKYTEMMKECRNAITVLYFHGGAYYLLDPSSHRATTKRIAKLTGGRVYSVRYRLAPQNPFPSALLDGLVTYLNLLYPPPGAIHEAVQPGNIVFAGDSAGGNLSLALLQAIMEIRRQKLKVTWFGEEREIPLPAGVAGNSPWVDITQSFPSCTSNAKWDYLPPPSYIDTRQTPADDIWPASPPRKHIFIDDAYLLHPLASLHLNASWEGSPPIYICTGWESLADENKYLATKLTEDGVPVVFEEYEAMPHCFAMVLSHIPEANRCFEGWTKFIKAVVADPKSIESSYTTIKARTCKEVEIDVKNLSPFTEQDLLKLAYEKIQRKQPFPDVPAKL